MFFSLLNISSLFVYHYFQAYEEQSAVHDKLQKDVGDLHKQDADYRVCSGVVIRVLNGIKLYVV